MPLKGAEMLAFCLLRFRAFPRHLRHPILLSSAYSEGKLAEIQCEELRRRYNPQLFAPDVVKDADGRRHLKRLHAPSERAEAAKEEHMTACDTRIGCNDARH